MQQGEATDPRLREAARKLIGAYMADESLAPHINALEAAAGFCQQGAEPPFVDHARTAHAAAHTTYGNTCHWCGHKHDPEDGRCDAHAHVGLGRCPCPGEGLSVAYDKINAALYVAEQDCAELRGRLEAAPEPEWEYRVSGLRPDLTGPIRWTEGSLHNARLRAEAMRATDHSKVVIERAPRHRSEWEALPDD